MIGLVLLSLGALNAVLASPRRRFRAEPETGAVTFSAEKQGQRRHLAAVAGPA